MPNRKTSLFISHASPEDNAFTTWLGAKLSGLGYDVWADIFKLVGGHDWQQRLEDALRQDTGKLLLVGTPEAAASQMVRNEIKVAYDVGRATGDSEFIIPLRLREFDAPFLTVHAQRIDFQQSWSQGFAELFAALEGTYKFPRNTHSSSDTVGYWRAVQLVHAQGVVEREEHLTSNWLALTDVPQKIFVYDFKAGVNLGKKEAAIENFALPIVPYSRGFIGFGDVDEYQEGFGSDLPLLKVAEINTSEFITRGSTTPDIDRMDARNFVTNIFRQAIEESLTQRGLSAFAMSERSQVMWPTIEVQPDEFVKFSWPNGPVGRRQITGRSEKRNFFGISVLR